MARPRLVTRSIPLVTCKTLAIDRGTKQPFFVTGSVPGTLVTKKEKLLELMKKIYPDETKEYVKIEEVTDERKELFGLTEEDFYIYAVPMENRGKFENSND